MSAEEFDFGVGSLVRVREGVRSPTFADVVLGGAAGAVCGAEGQLRLVCLSEAALAELNPVRREQFVAGVWLPAAQLEPIGAASAGVSDA